MSLIEKALDKARVGGDRDMPREVTRDVAPPAVRKASAAPSPLASRVTESPILMVDDSFLRSVGLRAPAEQLHQQMAEYRHIKRQLLTTMLNPSEPNKARIVLVSSAVAGDGKTFSATNLALSLALEPDFAVLLVDADIIKTSLSRAFGIADRKGLMDAAANPNIDVESLVLSTSMEGLSILPAGHPHPNATELFGSARMQQIMQQMVSAPNRIVVIDSLPLLLTTEVRSLIQHAGQVLLVVRADFTPQNAVQQSLDLLEGHENVQLMLNAAVRTRLTDYYSYSNGYSYTYGAAEALAAAKGKE